MLSSVIDLVGEIVNYIVMLGVYLPAGLLPTV